MSSLVIRDARARISVIHDGCIFLAAAWDRPLVLFQSARYVAFILADVNFSHEHGLSFTFSV
jgi:hypothetical protein